MNRMSCAGILLILSKKGVRCWFWVTKRNKVLGGSPLRRCWGKKGGKRKGGTQLNSQERTRCRQRSYTVLAYQLFAIPSGRELDVGRNSLRFGKSAGSRINCCNFLGCNCARCSNSSFNLRHSTIVGEFKSSWRINLQALRDEPIANPSGVISIVTSVNSKNGSGTDWSDLIPLQRAHE